MTKSSETVITASEVCKSFDSEATVLRGVSFQVNQGEIVSLIGPSGCGKSTLLRLIADLDAPSGGQLVVGSAEQRPKVGFVFQDPTLLPWRTVLRNISLPLEIAGGMSDQRWKAVRDSLRLIGLSSADEDKVPATLSGGMRMRVSLARTLVTEPEVLLLDEPFAALDEVLRQQLNEDLLRIWSERQSTMLFVTHNVSEAVFLSQRILVMSSNPGEIVDEIRVPFEYPRSWEVRTDERFISLVAETSRRLREVSV